MEEMLEISLPRLSIGMWDEEVQAVQDYCYFLAMLSREDIVKEGGFPCTKVACRLEKSADAVTGQKTPCIPVTIVIGTFLPIPSWSGTVRT